MKSIVYYHDSCADGFGAAFAAWLKLGDAAEYVPVQYGREPCLDGLDGVDIYILDFSFPLPVMHKMFEIANKVVWLDHHKTAFEAMGKSVDEVYRVHDRDQDVILDNNKSGALLAWEYFHPEKEMSELIRMIDDRDRWQFKMAMSKAAHAGLMANRPWKFDQWKGFTNLVHNNALGGLVAEGQVLLKKMAADVESSAKHANKCEISSRRGATKDIPGGDWHIGSYWFVEGLAVNCASNISEVGHALANQSGTYGLVWWYSATESAAVCSLRSNGDYDVSAIAKQFGGGGHKNAAGFKVSMTKLLEWL